MSVKLKKTVCTYLKCEKSMLNSIVRAITRKYVVENIGLNIINIVTILRNK